MEEMVELEDYESVCLYCMCVQKSNFAEDRLANALRTCPESITVIQQKCFETDKDSVHEHIHVDLFIPEKGLVVEVDGPSHDDERQKLRDGLRDAGLRRKGLEVMRIPISRICLLDPEADVNEIVREILAVPDLEKEEINYFEYPKKVSITV